MLRRFNVSTRVRTVLIIPMVVLVVAGAYIGWGTYQDFRTAQANAAAVHALDEFRGVVAAIRVEQVSTDDQRANDIASTNIAVDNFKRAAKEVDTSALPADSAVRLNNLVAAIDGLLDDARGLVEEESPKQHAAYVWVITDMQGFVRSWASLTPDRTLAQWLNAYDAMFTYSLAVSSEIRAGRSVIRSAEAAMRREGGGEVSAYAREGFVAENWFTETTRTDAVTALIDLPGRLDESLRNLNGISLTLDEGDEARKEALTLNMARATLHDAVKMTPYVEGDVPQVPTMDEWNLLGNRWFDQIAGVEESLTGSAGEAAAKARSASWIAGTITAGVLLLGLLIAWLVARRVAVSITRPLSHLTKATATVRDQLPRLVEQVSVPGEGPDTELPQVPVETSDEIGRLAMAFNDVNATTIQVAQEQAALRGSIAEMFVNVARRDQVLLNRQLAFVDSLERSEEDPTVLANLFHLDHLATRMRRNAESLLVLAGIDSGRRLRESMPLSDVIRTASSEIEQYDRVELDLNVDPLMLGFNALPAAHMLAELLENASVFSEPDTPVEVSTGMEGQFVTVTVLDHGIGMTESELASVNDKLSSTSPTDALGAQRLGLFVVSRLARRLGASVEVRHSSQGSGTETIVHFPVALFAGLETSSQAPVGVEQFADFDAPSSPAYQQAYADDPLPAVAFSASQGYPDQYGDPQHADPYAYSGSVSDAYRDQAAPDAREVDLAALTDGQTEQGLPRRRSGDDDAFILPPSVQAHELPSDFSVPATSGFTPTMAAGTGLPSRRQSVPAGPLIEPMDFGPTTPVDPSERQSLFSGFRGWSRTQNEAQEVERPSPFGGSRSWDAPADQPVSVGASGYDPDFDQTVGLTRRGRHSNDIMEGPTEVPYGHTESEVAAWHTGPIPLAEPADDSDWPSATWDTAPWQTGMFAAAGPMPTTFDQPSGDYYAPGPAGGFDSEAPGWATVGDDPAWQPVMDLSSEPLAPVAAPPNDASAWSWPAPGEAEQQPAAWADPNAGQAWQADEQAQWPAEPAGQWPQPEPAPDWTQPRSAAEWSQWSPGEGGQAQPDPAPWQAESAGGWAVESHPDDSARSRGLFGRKKDGDALDPGGSAWQPSPESAEAWSSTPDAAFDPGQGFTPAYVPAEAPPAASRTNLDDDVFAMLQLRSDIEEQALAELSQLSAYRPDMGGSGERLTRRVPTAVPAAVPGAGAAPIRRDADELRSRLASFQSGTSRGRRASLDQGA
ncbi:MAG: ATP-binding protein [Micrococcales bacterium]|nr:ATP-binding protein [Micrococcales bacterium]